jgi:hypothetical protein
LAELKGPNPSSEMPFDSVRVVVDLPSGERARIETRLHHVSWLALLDQEGDEFGAREHLFRVSVDREHASGDAVSPEKADEPALPTDRFEIARLTIVTYPVELADRDGWLSVCFGSEESHFYSWVEANCEKPPFWGGALLYAKNLDVRSAFRGQELGLKLLRAGIRSVNDDVGDDNPVVLIARPQNSRYEPEKEDEWRRSGPSSDDDSSWKDEVALSHSLARYYERLGFERWTSPDELTTMQVVYSMAASRLKRRW